LRRSDQHAKVLVLYEQTWGKVQPPSAMAPEFQTQSNWYRIGQRFAQRLEEAEKRPQAEVVKKKIEETLGKINNTRAARGR
jgi:hypothetical protein